MTVDSNIEIVESLHAEMRSDLPDASSLALTYNLYFDICIKHEEIVACKGGFDLSISSCHNVNNII